MDVMSFFGTEWSVNWATALVIDTKAPEPPDEIHVVPDSKEMTATVTLRLPYNPQNDIDKIVVLRKEQTTETDEFGDVHVKRSSQWVTITEVGPTQVTGTYVEHVPRQTAQLAYDRQGAVVDERIVTNEVKKIEKFVVFAPMNSIIVDSGLEYGKRYVYSAFCMTRHGEVSTLSEQIGVTLNSEWAREGENLTDYVSSPGVHRYYDTGDFGVIPQNTRRVVPSLGSVPSTFALSGRLAEAEFMKKPRRLVVRVESLDTGQRIDTGVSLSYSNISP
jgi:hypothetical protein